MQQYNQHWNVTIPWVLATIAGVVIGILSILTFVSSLALTGTSTVLVGIIGGVALGGGVGIAQWLVLRRYVRSAIWWIVVSWLGWMTSLSVGAGIVDLVGVLGSLLVVGVVSGVATGWLLAQLVSGHAAPSLQAGAT
jgi:hypothetical protein